MSSPLVASPDGMKDHRRRGERRRRRVYLFGDRALVATVDFHPPVGTTPHRSAVAAANALCTLRHGWPALFALTLCLLASRR